MKKINLLFFMMALGAATFFSSCQKDEILNPEPSINFKGGSGYTSTDVTISAGESIKVGINAVQNSETKSDLTTFTIVVTQNNTPQTVINETLTSDQKMTYVQDFNITFETVGSANLVARITDKDGEYNEVMFTVTVKEEGVTVKKKSNVEFGSFNDAIGSFYGTATETIYTISGGANNQAKVDMIFFKGATNGNTLAAPDDADVNSITDFNLNTWTTKNKTRFQTTTMTAAEFDAIGTLHAFPAFNDATALTKAKELANGKVVYFKTEAGKHGYFKVVDLYTKGDKAKFDFIVEQ
jgi:hypothetical protein